MDHTTFEAIRFSRNHTSVGGTVTPDELLAFLNRPDVDLLVAERIGQPDVFAQVADLGGAYRFEVTVDGELMGTMLDSTDAVLAAFADWAIDRPGWRDQHTWD
jgi:hypothetical protein